MKRRKPALAVRKTYKLYQGGEFIRSESGRYAVLNTTGGEAINFSHASRKDFRDAVVSARTAQPGWAKKSAYLRGQILYRAAEMLEGRRAEFVELLTGGGGGQSRASAENEVRVSIDRLVYYAGWSDKFLQVFGSVNPVASSHFNFTVTEPVGVAVLLTPPRPLLLPAVTLLAASLVGGNAALLLASEENPIPSLVLGEVLATSDFPGGVANILAGPRGEMLKTLGSHLDVDSIVDASGQSQEGKALAMAGAINLKRFHQRMLEPAKWLGEASANPYWILDTLELKTAWHPIGF